MTLLAFTQYIPPRKTTTGKLTPPKAVGSDGREYALPKDAVDLIQANIGKPLDVDTATKQNGTFTNYSVTAVRIPATAPESAPIQTPSPTPREAVVPTAASTPPSFHATATATWRPMDPRESLRIVRQSAVKAATELVATDKLPFESLLAFAQSIVNWVCEEESGGLNGGGGEVQGVLPVTRAQSALDTAREKAVDRRAGYEDSDLVCGGCGYKEALVPTKTGGYFCDRKKNGCGHPPFGTRDDKVWSYGEWREKALAESVPWK